VCAVIDADPAWLIGLRQQNGGWALPVDEERRFNRYMLLRGALSADPVARMVLDALFISGVPLPDAVLCEPFPGAPRVDLFWKGSESRLALCLMVEGAKHAAQEGQGGALGGGQLLSVLVSARGADMQDVTRNVCRLLGVEPPF
jgi:hypothetical protein